jgi:hypothetical protein
MLYSETDLMSVTTGEDKFFDRTKQLTTRYRHATFASGSSSFRTSVGTEFLKVAPIQQNTFSKAQYPHLVRMLLGPLNQYPFLVIAAAMKKDCKQDVDFCFMDQVYLNTNLHTLSALLKAKANPMVTHLILTVKLRHVLFRDQSVPRIKYVLEHVEEVGNTRLVSDQEIEALEEARGLDTYEQYKPQWQVIEDFPAPREEELMMKQKEETADAYAANITATTEKVLEGLKEPMVTKQKEEDIPVTNGSMIWASEKERLAWEGSQVEVPTTVKNNKRKRKLPKHVPRLNFEQMAEKLSKMGEVEVENLNVAPTFRADS